MTTRRILPLSLVLLLGQMAVYLRLNGVVPPASRGGV